MNRADQAILALPEAMRVLTSPVETGAVTLCCPQDTQTEAFDYPEALFEKRVWVVPRNRADRDLVSRAAAWIRESVQPMVIAGGGVLYSEATDALAAFVEQTGIPVGETQAGKGSLSYDHANNLGAVGVTGTPGANIVAREADLVIAIGTRLSDFTTASKTAFQNPDVKFIAVNVAEFDAGQTRGITIGGRCAGGVGGVDRSSAGVSRVGGFDTAGLPHFGRRGRLKWSAFTIWGIGPF